MRSVVASATSLSGGGKAATRFMMSARNAATRSGTMPPGFTASLGRLDTFCLPDKITGSVFDRSMANAMIEAWRRDGIFQVAMSPQQQLIYNNANAASRRFFKSSSADKLACVDNKSYAGYIASGEEITDGVADYSEIFTVTKDLPVDDRRVVSKWPCHGPCPWPSTDMKVNMAEYMDDLSRSGDQLLKLVELGLNVPQGSLKRYTEDGWHHMRVLRYVRWAIYFSPSGMSFRLTFNFSDFPIETEQTARVRKAVASGPIQITGCWSWQLKTMLVVRTLSA
jgi:hypothetical protein